MANDWSRRASWQRGCGNELKYTEMCAQIANLITAVDGVISRTSAVASPHGATAQVITAQATTSAKWWGTQQSRDHAVAICWSSAPTAKGITLH